ncbi:MAG: cupin domain-containing protein [Rhodobacter sp.]|nr:cupin domain-containing protein [Rhodobacter sp.]MCA3514708.1 cupin domain-containing protein [Rhodobacter sp.]MCA3518590.1 cupin domain-containing protein [Rhodobacter sp.]MCA3523873.1 cupin domain-containing protein [Rhodobacter sp.]MCA3525389.1 cupin domain-containing protein [Rhodobacter sp.]
MTIRHHLSDPLLMAYSAGQLPEAFSLVVATHVSLCDECRARLMAFDALGGAIVEDAGQARMAGDSFEATMARITGMPQAEPVSAPRIPGGVFPAPLRDYTGGDLSAVKWRSVGMGVRQAILKTDSGATARLLHIPAGQAVPDHGHRGLELTLVLQGAFRDTEDRFGPGDVEIATQDLEHTPVAEPGADCICLAATDAPLRFNRLMPRIAQPFLRI